MPTPTARWTCGRSARERGTGAGFSFKHRRPRGTENPSPFHYFIAVMLCLSAPGNVCWDSIWRGCRSLAKSKASRFDLAKSKASRFIPKTGAAGPRPAGRAHPVGTTRSVLPTHSSAATLANPLVSRIYVATPLPFSFVRLLLCPFYLVHGRSFSPGLSSGGRTCHRPVPMAHPVQSIQPITRQQEHATGTIGLVAKRGARQLAHAESGRKHGKTDDAS